MVNAAPPLEVRGLSAGYERGAPIVEGVGFTLRSGTMTAVVGPNGAGKSTLLKAVLGTTPWRAGEALFFGHALDEVRQRKLHQVKLHLTRFNLCEIENIIQNMQ